MSDQTRCDRLIQIRAPGFLTSALDSLPAIGLPRGRIISGVPCSIGFGRTASQSINIAVKNDRG